MYTKTSLRGLALAFALTLGILAIASPQNIYADSELVETKGSTAKVEFDGGELSLAQVTTFDFGTQDISSSTADHTATSVDNDIQVSDLRGNGKGWDLNVSLSDFVHATNSKKLNGAYVTLSGTQVAGVNGTIGTAPTSTSTESLKIDADGSELPIFVAATDAGMGVWGITTELTDATLTVLTGTAYAGAYEANLTWTLQTTP
jgi:hypothetical protein